jgi:hypothetical protein
MAFPYVFPSRSSAASVAPRLSRREAKERGITLQDVRLWERPVSAKPRKAKARNVTLRCTQSREVGQDVANHRRELEAVAGTR